MVIHEVNLGIKSAKRFYDMFSEEFKSGDEITVDFINVKRIDLSIVQIIVAAGRKARQEGKTIKLKSVSSGVRDQMMVCGLKF